MLDAGEALTLKAQRAVLGPGALAREFTEADISPDFKANGSTEVDDAGYQALAANGFKDFRLEVGGLVNNEIELSLDELARYAVAHPDHPARLRRGLELPSANGPACR